RWVVAALRLEECSLGGSRQVRYFMEEGLDPFPARGIHPGASARSPQLMRQPCLGGSPVAENGGLRYAEQLGAFRHVEAAEEPALDHQRLARLKAGELLEGGVQAQQFDGACRRLRSGRPAALAARHPPDRARFECLEAS